MLLVIKQRYALAWPQPGKHLPALGLVLPAEEALAAHYPTDAHFCPAVAYEKDPRVVSVHTADAAYSGRPYEAPRYRFKIEALKHHPIIMRATVVDIDDPVAHAGGEPDQHWRERTRQALWKCIKAEGGCYYATRGGFRALWRCYIELREPDDYPKIWRPRYQRWLDHLKAHYGLVCDEACGDFTRLYRLPNVEREGVGEQRAEIIGELTTMREPALLPGAAKIATADLHKLADRLTRQADRGNASALEIAPAIRALIEGREYAPEGSRDVISYKLCAEIAKAFPNGDPDDLSEHFRASLDLMGDDAPDLENISSKIERNQINTATVDAADAAAGKMVSASGVPLVCEANILAHSVEAIGESIARDTFLRRDVVIGDLPWSVFEGTPREWSDTDDAQLLMHLQRTVSPGIRLSSVLVAVGMMFAERERNCVRDYLTSLPDADGSDVFVELLLALAVDVTEFTIEVIRTFCTAAVSRIMVPGCKVDAMLVNEGPENLGKSSAWRMLFGEAWFCDTTFDLNSKDRFSALEGVWCYEVAELDAFKGKDATRIKSFLSSQQDRYRPAYARRAVTALRSCVFVGTTNEEQYLAEGVGNRRFWPIKSTGYVDLEAIVRLRDRLWSHAVADYQAGRKCYLDKRFSAMLKTENYQRELGDDLDLKIQAHLDGKSDASLLDLYDALTGGDATKQNRALQTRVGIILRRLGWRRYGPRAAGTIRCWAVPIAKAMA